MKHIVLLTPGQPVTNPRLLKEAVALEAAGYQVTVIYAYCVSWGDKYDHQTFAAHPNIRWLRAAGHPLLEKSTYLLSRIIHRFYKVASMVMPGVSVFRFSVNRPASYIHKQALSIKADVYRAHSLCTIPIAVAAAEKYHAKSSVDFEDHYSGQWLRSSTEFRIARKLESVFLPSIHFSTSASRLIHEEYVSKYPSLKDISINNTFSKKYAAAVISDSYETPLKLFWFSQTVGKGRGLQDVIQAMGLLRSQEITLTLLGNCNQEMKEHIYQFADQTGAGKSSIILLPACAPDEIFKIAATHHIGLALEEGDTLNRQICLTNKLFTYLLSGLATIATDTPAQKQFLESFQDIGVCYTSGDTKTLSMQLARYQVNRTKLECQRRRALSIAKGEMNWEAESERFISFFKQQVVE